MRNVELDINTLLRFSQDLLEAISVPTDAARVTAECLVEAEQRGLRSHGLLRLPIYMQAIESGDVDVNASPRIVTEFGAMVVLDGKNGLGQSAMSHAVELGMARVKTYGASVLAVRNSNHYGMGAFWTERLARNGYIAMLTSTTDAQVAPSGGHERVLGTNPLSLSFPSLGSEPMTVDMSTSAGAYGRVLAAANEETEIPEGWAVDSTGQSTTDPHSALNGALLPFGGHKGSSLAVGLEALAALPANGPFAFEGGSTESPDLRFNASHFLLTLNTSVLDDRAQMSSRLEKLRDTVRASADGDRVLAPGDIEHQARRKNSQTVTLSAATFDELNDTADSCNVERLQPIRSEP